VEVQHGHTDFKMGGTTEIADNFVPCLVAMLSGRKQGERFVGFMIFGRMYDRTT
jgi:hypothetical protein